MKLPQKFIERYKDLIPEFNDFLESLNTPYPLGIRINTLKGKKEKIIERIKRFDPEPLPWYEYGFIIKKDIKIGNTIEHFAGLIYVQNVSSMVPVYILAPKPGEKILDIAAAPGSKTTQIAQHMENKGLLVANDINLKRIKALTGNLDRTGVINVVVTQKDGRAFGRILPEFFDRVLVDAPCSAEGTIATSFKVTEIWSESSIKRLSKLQTQLLISGFRALKKGGVLVYSTCTFAPEENEEVITNLLKIHPEASVEKIEIPGLKIERGIIEWKGKKYNPEVEKLIRIYPHKVKGEGFCIAKIRKE